MKTNEQLKNKQDDINKTEKEIGMVFEAVKLKVLYGNNEYINIMRGWDDYTSKQLSKQLDDEWSKWKETSDSRQLIEIIALAALLKVSVFYDSLFVNVEDELK